MSEYASVLGPVQLCSDDVENRWRKSYARQRPALLFVGAKEFITRRTHIIHEIVTFALAHVI